MDKLLEDDDFGECSFLKDTELEKHRQMSTKNQDVIAVKFDLLSKLLFQLLSVEHLDQSKNECFARVRKLKCDKDSLSNRINDTEKECAVLSSEIQELPNLVVEKNNEVQCLCQNLEQLKSAVADLTLDTRERQKKFKLAHESTKIAKLFYKDALGCHTSFIRADGDNLELLLSYSRTRPVTLDPIPPNSIKFQFNPNEKTWKVLETNPPLENFKQLALKLDKSQDIQGFVAYVRSATQIK